MYSVCISLQAYIVSSTEGRCTSWGLSEPKGKTETRRGIWKNRLWTQSNRTGVQSDMEHFPTAFPPPSRVSPRIVRGKRKIIIIPLSRSCEILFLRDMFTPGRVCCSIIVQWGLGCCWGWREREGGREIRSPNRILVLVVCTC